jgi:hypothetical protein
VATPATLASEQQAAQIGLIVVMLRDLAKVWQLLQPQSLDQSLPRWVTAVHAVVARYAPMAAVLAADHYDAARIAARAPGQFTASIPDPPSEGLVDAAMRWSTRNVWGLDEATLPERIAAAETMANDAASKLVADAARSTVTDAVAVDPEAIGWARIAKPSACAFCRMLSTRRAVYTADTVTFRAHNGCNCVAVPVFKGEKWQPPSYVRQWEKDYRKAAQAKGDTLNNFRRLVEGRA